MGKYHTHSASSDCPRVDIHHESMPFSPHNHSVKSNHAFIFFQGLTKRSARKKDSHCVVFVNHKRKTKESPSLRALVIIPFDLVSSRRHPCE
jgi:hypothetical protein